MKNFPTIVLIIALGVITVGHAFAGQGAGRMLYTVSTNTFIENTSGDSTVTINDTSGSIPTLQSLINNARSANPSSIIIIHLLSGATYAVNNNNGGLVLGSQECLVGSGALIQATNSAVTNALITISNGSTNVSIAGGVLDGAGANIYGIYAPSSSARINIDKVTVRNCGEDCIQLNGQGVVTFDNEMTVTRCDTSNSPGHAGISFWNATQAVCVDNNCHNNSVGVWLGNCGDSTVVNNTCNNNTTGIDINSGNENNVANNTCNNNGTGIIEADTNTMVASDSLGSNTVAGINSTGKGNFFIDNLFTAGNATNFISAGTGNYVVPYQAAINAPGQNYFYPPLINNQHTNVIVNGMGRYDLTNNASTTMDTVQTLYNAASSANPGDVIVLHLNGTYTVGANPLTLHSNTCILLGGEIEINSATTASSAIQATNPSQLNISLSGGIIDGGNQTGNNGLYFLGAGMVQVDGTTLQNFGPDNPRVGGSDVIRFDGESNGGKPPYIATRCTINGGAARGIWSQNDGIRGLYSDNTVSNVNMDGVDCDSGTSGALVKFNNLSGNVRYGVFFEQRDTYDCAIGNVCNNDGRDLNDYNNDEPGSPVQYNSDICNSCNGGGNGIRSGSTGLNGGSDSTNTLTCHNFFFDNVVQSSTGDGIEGDQAGRQNYYSQNYLAGNSTAITTSGSEAFFNPPDVSGYQYVQDSNSGLEAVVTNASTTQGAAVILGPTNLLGSDQWSLIPTDSGYYQLKNKNSKLDLAVMGSSANAGAPIIQQTFGASQNDQWIPVSAGNGLYYLVNRHSGLYLDVPGASTSPGTQLDQQTFSGGANQQFDLIDTLAVTVIVPTSPITWNGGSATDSDWSDAANWNGTNVAANDPLSFGGNNHLNNTNDTAAGTVYSNILFNAGAGAFVLNGNSVTVAGGITNNSSNPQTIALGLVFNGSQTFNGATSSLIIGGGLTNTANANSLTLTGTGILTNLLSSIPATATNTLVLAGNANWTLVNSSASTAITVPWLLQGNSGTLNFGSGSSAPTLASVTIHNGPQDSQFGAAANSGATLNIINGTLALNTLNTANALNSTGIVNVIGGTFNLGPIGSVSSDYFQGANGANAGEQSVVTISGGTMNVKSASAPGPFYVASRGSGSLILSGTGALNCGTLDISRNANGNSISSSGIVSLNGGTLSVSRVGTATANAQTGGSPTARLNFNGGTLMASANSTTFYQGSTVAPITPITSVVQSGGAIINDGGFAISILEPLESGAISDGGLTKLGNGTVTLGKANTYNGPTTINAGTLALGATGSISDTAAIIIAGGTEFNVSALSSPFMLGSGQVLSNSVSASTAFINGNINTGAGTLSLTYDFGTPLLNILSGTLTLSSSTILKINNTVTPLPAGTYPIITGNLAGTAPASFTFTGGIAAGTTASLQMSASALNLVIAPASPRITGIRLNGATLTITATNGMTVGQYVLMQSTNLLLPLSQWTPVLTNTFDGSGNLNLATNIVNPNNAQVFYFLQIP